MDVVPGDGPGPWPVLKQTVRAGPGHVGASILLALGGAAATLAVPGLLAVAIDAAVGGRPSGTALWLLAAAMVMTAAAEGGAVLLERRTQAYGTLALRRAAHHRLLRADLADATRFRTGDLVSRVLQATTVAATAPSILSAVITSVATSAGGLIALYLVDHRLAALVVVCAPLVWWQATWITRRLSADTGDYQTVQAELTDRFTDALRGARTIRANATVEREVRRVLAGLPLLHAAGLRFWRTQGTAIQQSALLMPLLKTVVLAVAGHGAMTGRVSLGEVIAAQAYFGLATGVFRQQNLVGRLARAHGSAGRIAEMLAVTQSPAGTLPLPAGPGALRLRDVSVSRNGQRILDRVDLDVPAGFTVAVVGSSGSGKSSLAQVAGGLLAPDTGQVCLDGVDISRARRDTVRRTVGYAFAQPVLLGDTVADAVGYCDHPPAGPQTAAALRDAAMDAFVSRLPARERTPLGSLRLSGGETQRLALARLAWRDARLIVLDDATSSLDSVTEAVVLAAFDRRFHGRTRLTVTPRASVAASADLVAWLERGRIRALAPHRELWRDADYRSMFATPAVLDPAG